MLVPCIIKGSRSQYNPTSNPLCTMVWIRNKGLLNHWDQTQTDKYTLWILNSDYVLNNNKSPRKKSGDFKILFSGGILLWYPIMGGKSRWDRKWRRTGWDEAHHRASVRSCVCSGLCILIFSAFSKKDLKSWSKGAYFYKSASQTGPWTPESQQAILIFQYV